MIALHRPRTHPSKADVTRLGSIVIKRIPAHSTAAPLLTGRCRKIHRIAIWLRTRAQRAAQRSAPAAMRRALIRSAIAPVRSHAQLVLLGVIPAIVGLDAHARVPSCVRVKRAVLDVRAAGEGGPALVRAGCGAVVVVAILEFCDLVAEPALYAAWAWGGAVGRWVGVVAEGNEGGEGWWGQLGVRMMG